MNKTSRLQNKKILIIDDNPQILEIIHISLSDRGAVVFTAENGEEGLRALYEHHPDLVVLDVAMPVMDGWETCRRIRELTAVPIIMVTAFSEEDDIVYGLRMGAIDYITKPFTMRILHARIEAALRQAEATAVPPKAMNYRDDYLMVDLVQREVCVAETAVHLSKTEFALLKYLIQHRDRPLASQDIIENVWGEKYFDGLKNLYVYISQLRQKLEKNPAKPEYILTEYGVGYRFNNKEKQPQNETAVSF